MKKPIPIPREYDPDAVGLEGAKGQAPADARPVIVRLVEIEAVDPDKRTTLQTEALDLWQSQIGDLGERQETVAHFIREGGPFDRFTNFLRNCGLADQVVEIYELLYKAIEAVGWPTSESVCTGTAVWAGRLQQIDDEKGVGDEED